MALKTMGPKILQKNRLDISKTEILDYSENYDQPPFTWRFMINLNPRKLTLQKTLYIKTFFNLVVSSIGKYSRKGQETVFIFNTP
jgi:hypothetical protein